MGFYVGVNFSFSCDNKEGLSEMSRKTLSEFNDTANYNYTKIMLETFRDMPNKVVFNGNKGSMCLWGGVWNYYNKEVELPLIKLFLKNVWNFNWYTDDIILFDFDRALLMINEEQSEVAEIYELSLKENVKFPIDAKEIIVKHKTVDLCWNQC